MPWKSHDPREVDGGVSRVSRVPPTARASGVRVPTESLDERCGDEIVDADRSRCAGGLEEGAPRVVLAGHDALVPGGRLRLTSPLRSPVVPPCLLHRRGVVLAADRGDIHLRRRELQTHLLQRVRYDLRDGEIAKPLVVGRDDVPWRVLRARLLHGVLERLNVVGPELALGLFVRYVLTRVGGVDLAESNLLPGLDDELLPVVHEGGLPVAGVPIR